jgi:hypothetical protein
MKSNVSVERLIVATRSSGPPAIVKIIKEKPGSIASATPYIISCFHSNVELYFSYTTSRVATLMVRVSVFVFYYRTSYRLQWEL